MPESYIRREGAANLRMYRTVAKLFDLSRSLSRSGSTVAQIHGHFRDFGLIYVLHMSADTWCMRSGSIFARWASGICTRWDTDPGVRNDEQAEQGSGSCERPGKGERENHRHAHPRRPRRHCLEQSRADVARSGSADTDPQCVDQPKPKPGALSECYQSVRLATARCFASFVAQTGCWNVPCSSMGFGPVEGIQ